MEIQFTSDTSTFDRGFKLRYDVIGKKTDVDCGETNLPLWPWFTLSLIYPILIKNGGKGKKWRVKSDWSPGSSNRSIILKIIQILWIASI